MQIKALARHKTKRKERENNIFFLYIFSNFLDYLVKMIRMIGKTYRVLTVLQSLCYALNTFSFNPCIVGNTPTK